MRVVCLDSQILVWGVKKVASPGQEEMIPLAEGFMKLLARENPLILIPSVVLFELLMPLPTSVRTAFIGRFSSTFMVVPFDVPAAQHAATVWHTKTEEGVIEQVKADFGASRHALKADTQIIGTALAQGASAIYSHDKPLKRLAEGFIDVLTMEMDPDSQPTLFDGAAYAAPVADPEPPRIAGEEDEEDRDA